MKKVLLITTVSGFVPQFEMENVKILQDMGYEVHYASNYHYPSYGNDNRRLEHTGIICHQVDFVRSPFRVCANLRAYKQLCQVMKEDKYCMVHCHTPMGALLGRLAARKSRVSGTKVLYTAHGFHFYKGAPLINWLFYYPVERCMMRYTDVLFTITKEDYDRAVRFRKKGDQKIYHIPGVGINIEKFNRTERRCKKKFTKFSDKFVLISVGELNKNKNHEVIIKAISKIKEKKIVYLICGQGKLEKKLKNLVHKYHLEKQVYLLGYQENIEKLLNKADIFIFPSYREGLSVALQEAMAAGLPAIVSDIRGNKELIDENVGGWRVAPGKEDEWEQAIKKALETDLKKMGEYNKEKIQEYSKAKVSSIMKKAYKNILE